MAQKTIYIEMTGLHEHSGRLRLSEFIGKLKDIVDALKHKERMVSGFSKQNIVYDIVKLSYSSPYKIGVNAYTDDSFDDYNSDEVVNGFLRDISMIHEGNTPDFVDSQIFEAYKKVGQGVGDVFENITISSDDYSCEIKPDFVHKIALAEGPEHKVYGSIVGRIEAINAHGSTREFRLYPQIGPSKVTCRFPVSLVKQAGDAFYKRVTVTGWLRFKRGAEHPHLINVDDIHVHLEPSEIPKLSTLRGMAPDITGGMRSEDFVRANRDADH